VAPGHETVTSFRAINPGLFIYNSSAAPVEMHMETGLYGLVLVEPRKGSSMVDREYYLMHGVYTKEHSMNDLIAETGETIRLFIGNIDSIPITCERIIRNTFRSLSTASDQSSDPEMHARSIPSGGTAIVEFKVKASNEYTIESAVVYELEEVFGEDVFDVVTTSNGNLSFDQKIELGALIYDKLCQRCHMSNGEGLKEVYPPLQASDHFAHDLSKAIGPVVNGMEGPITVNGMAFNGVMPRYRLSDRQVAAVVTYVANNFDNAGGEVTVKMVKEIRK
jgi:nitrite reductase (NO-forming)